MGVSTALNKDFSPPFNNAQITAMRSWVEHCIEQKEAKKCRSY